MPAQSSPRRSREQQKRERDRRDRRPTPAVNNALTGPPDAPVGESTPFETLLRIIRVHKIWVLQGLIIVPLLVMAATLTQEKTYTATANLLFRDDATGILDQNTGATLSDPTRVAATNDALIALPTVAGRAAKIVGDGVTAADVRSAINIGSGQESDVVEISATTPDPERSAAIANAYGEAYLAFRRDTDRAQLQEAIDLAERNIEALQPSERESEQGQRLQENLDRLRQIQALQTGKADLVQRAAAPTEPSGPDVKRNLVLGILLGAIVGLGLGALRDRLDQTLHTPEDLENVYRLPVLARVPKMRRIGRKQAQEAEEGWELEAFRTLRANLRYFNVSGRLQSILVSSPMPGDGKSTVARFLASTMASMGDRVVLVEADLHKPSSSMLNGKAPQVGLSSVLGGTELDDALVTVPVRVDAQTGEPRELTLLPSGPIPPNAFELLESTRMARVLDQLEREFDVVIVDSPALTHVSDVRALVGEVSGVVIVSALNHTTRSAAQDFRKQIQLLEGNALGVVANLAPAPRGGYYY
jgi:capsular exopolysaccharide synthesis family protein